MAFTINPAIKKSHTFSSFINHLTMNPSGRFDGKVSFIMKFKARLLSFAARKSRKHEKEALIVGKLRETQSVIVSEYKEQLGRETNIVSEEWLFNIPSLRTAHAAELQAQRVQFSTGQTAELLSHARKLAEGFPGHTVKIEAAGL
ncbi:hypothetical protein N7495_004345 [Penicillium taxi]|uniref:uncharacterized protein n=1 Tax=Penicillium taxi TaxID=168475 RepID=UPI0025455AA7|nr:uncharacterized protein N7495_004345 [Penicillium taxi]KAJ5899601.1 hypothetical protein N7495_004345 [Penicillium taxi]